MTRRTLLGCLTLAALTVTAAAGDPPTKAPAKTHPAFETLKSLAGTWVEADKDGKPTDKVMSVIKVTAGGSAVHETFSPGQAMEMISVYHLDGPDLVMTHYCAVGNQPRVKLDPKASTAKKLVFKFAGGTNLDPAKDMHMHDSTITIKDADHIEAGGVGWVNGKPAEDHCGVSKLVRKK